MCEIRWFPEGILSNDPGIGVEGGGRSLGNFFDQRSPIKDAHLEASINELSQSILNIIKPNIEAFHYYYSEFVWQMRSSALYFVSSG